MDDTRKGLSTENQSVAVGEGSKGRSLEERLEPWLASGEWVLILVFGVILWTAGFVDLFTHKSEPTQILGLYSIPFAGLLVVYALGYVFWYKMIVDPRGVTWLKLAVRYVQKRTWLVALLGLVFSAVIASMMVFTERWIRFPLLEAALFIMILLIAAVIVFAKAEADSKVEPWRRVMMAIVVVLVVLEIVFQIMARLGVLPFPSLGGVFQPGARVYQNDEGRGYGITNKFGFYYPEFRLEDGDTRIVLTGDSFVQGLQVVPTENMGVVLDKLLNKYGENASSFEVLSLGMPDYGPTVYLEPRLAALTLDPIKPKEVIVLFHLVNDFQSLTTSNGIIPLAILDKDGKPSVVDQDLELRHTLWHVTLRGYDPPNPVRIVRANLLTLGLGELIFQNVFKTQPTIPPGYSTISTVTESEPFGASSFMFESAGNPRFAEDIQLATSQLLHFKEGLDKNAITLRLVTIPYFPASFYTENQGSIWTEKLGNYDLFLPDTALKQIADENGIPFLSLGQFMQNSDLTADEIKTLFFKNGTGRFTAAGHEFVANALHTCFYATIDEAPLACAAK